jgi:isoleucyl-tRNA synthetase
VIYAAADGWKPGGPELSAKNELDRWVLSRLQRLVDGANGAFQDFEHFRLIEAFQAFNEEFSNWYLRRSRRRFWNGEKEAYQTLYKVLTTVTRLMAPALPFFTEEIYQNLVCSVDPAAPISVHLTRYPQLESARSMSHWRKYRDRDSIEESRIELANAKQNQDSPAAGHGLRAAKRRGGSQHH